MLALIVLIASATPPEDGLRQRFETGESFQEILSVNVLTGDSQDADGRLQSAYTLTLETRTDSVESAEKALLDAKVVRVQASAEAGSIFRVTFDSSPKPVEDRDEASADTSTALADDLVDKQAARDTETLEALWSGFRGVSLVRAATIDGGLSHVRTIGLPTDVRGQPQETAFEQSLSVPLSWSLPPGPVESWTDEAKWPTDDAELTVLRLYNYQGRTEGGLHKIDVSMASTGDADPNGKPLLAARGTLLFEPQLGRITNIDLLIERATPRKTRTIIAWRLQPIAISTPIEASGVDRTASPFDTIRLRGDAE